MAKCTKCGEEVPAGADLPPQAASYPACPKCWAGWKEYQVIVMNEMRLDMSMPEHRKLLKKHEKVFLGVLKPDGGVSDYTDEDNRKPDEQA
ncbi:MAG: Fe(2+)-trafficking protein [Nitrosopumilus sp.]|nr:Fe(2+)-trafficking protein [Nitrosopumilus sp.]CAI9832105.1 conserved hypothetical protein [Nitrosopumilaceae archaeon]MDA7941397.1 Fe(2+)-trafficking protein [Nitrosopumilus sp.]MDA7942805.1 Fe(2+)-trafficking protein [Nitrosopumilus sp.]MDA7945091.1 Fe(2+)-trafficking protein [Nitrosopumilus sp.]